MRGSSSRLFLPSVARASGVDQVHLGRPGGHAPDKAHGANEPQNYALMVARHVRSTSATN